jgi:hypothetical protein
LPLQKRQQAFVASCSSKLLLQYRFTKNRVSKIDFEKNIQTDIFGADMKVELLDDGPATIIIDTKQKDPYSAHPKSFPKGRTCSTISELRSQPLVVLWEEVGRWA